MRILAVIVMLVVVLLGLQIKAAVAQPLCCCVLCDGLPSEPFPRDVDLCEDLPSDVACEDYCLAHECLFAEYGDIYECTPGLTYQANTYCEDLLANFYDVKVFLEGPYSAAQKTAINQHLPSTQPFSGSPWLYSGTESVQSMPANIVDWLLLELRYGLDASTTIARQAVLLAEDGQIVDTSGGNPSMRGGASAYVVVRSRNHLDIMSATPIDLFPLSGVDVDFRWEIPAYGTNPQKSLGLGLYAMYAGDSDGDGILDISDFFTQTATGASGYQTADYNLDGSVGALDYNLYVANEAEGASSQVP